MNVQRTGDHSPPAMITGCRSDQRQRRRAFTLIELMVVLVLVSLVVGATVLRIDGVTRQGRLRSALQQCAAFDRLGRTQAVAEGRPRRLVFTHGEAGCRLEGIEPHGGRMDWSAGVPLRWGASVVVHRAGPAADELQNGPASVRIRLHADGSSATYAVVLSAADTLAAVVMDGYTGVPRYHAAVDEEQLQRLMTEALR